MTRQTRAVSQNAYRLAGRAAVVAVIGLAAMVVADDKLAVPKEFDGFRSLIGEWRGVGQVRRGSARGAWKESAEWRYDFQEDRPRVVLDVADGTHVDELIVSRDDDSLSAELVRPDGSRLPLAADEQSEKVTVFTSLDESDEAYRLTLTRLNEKRTLLLIENRRAGAKSFRRLGEVGYTREGTRLASGSSNGPECVVTGGKGTIPVSYQGKTYYVCCTGCKQAFDAEPEAFVGKTSD